MLLLSIFLVHCISGDDEKNGSEAEQQPLRSPANYSAYIGTSACLDCHADIGKSFTHTAHFHSSAIAADSTILGPLAAGKNSFHFNQAVYLQVEQRKDSFFQVEYLNGVERKARRFDISIGSGKRGQSFAYKWKDTLFQLPLTYFTAYQEWTNSPGYPNRVMFGRPITSRCLECHTTFAEVLSSFPARVDEINSDHIIYGIGCERCHGPGAEHAAFMKEKSAAVQPVSYGSVSNFTRQQKLDMCILCHGGRLKQTQPAFSFQPGDSLSEFFNLDSNFSPVRDIDVHGNQYPLMAASKCFRQTDMTCLSCHDPHNDQRKQVSFFVKKCKTCHQEIHSSGSGTKMPASLVDSRCIDCHMPEQRSFAISVLRQYESVPTPAMMRTHYISTYPEVAKTIIAEMKK